MAGADLLSGEGELTEVGSVFVNNYKDLQRCEGHKSSLSAATSEIGSDDVVMPGEIAGEHCCSGVE